jgi:hypothetical protein
MPHGGYGRLRGGYRDTTRTFLHHHKSFDACIDRRIGPVEEKQFDSIKHWHPIYDGTVPLYVVVYFMYMVEHLDIYVLLIDDTVRSTLGSYG